MPQVLLEVLNARLADIREWWATGALQARGFGAPQVAHLVRALFEPTEMRAQVQITLAFIHVRLLSCMMWLSFDGGRLQVKPGWLPTEILHISCFLRLTCLRGSNRSWRRLRLERAQTMLAAEGWKARRNDADDVQLWVRVCAQPNVEVVLASRFAAITGTNPQSIMYLLLCLLHTATNQRQHAQTVANDAPKPGSTCLQPMNVQPLHWRSANLRHSATKSPGMPFD